MKLNQLAITKCFLLTVFLLNSTNIYAGGDQSGGQRDPLRTIFYRQAFYQDDIYAEFKDLLYTLGCTENIRKEKIERNSSVMSSVLEAFRPTPTTPSPINHNQTVLDFSHEQPQDALLPTENMGYAKPLLDKEPTTETNRVSDKSIKPPRILTFEELKEQLPRFEKKCLEKLKAARRFAILEPGRESLILLTLMGGATGAAIVSSGGMSSFGGSFSIFAVLFNSVWFLRDMIRSSLYLCFTPQHPVDELEVIYAIFKIFIPNKLWAKIETKFMMARQNAFEMQAALDFLDFSLGLQTFRPKKVAQISSKLLAAQIQLTYHIKKYFEDSYLSSSPEGLTKEDLNKLIAGVNLFVAKVFAPDKAREAGRDAIFLTGPGGIGKTRFAKELVKWINAVIEEHSGGLKGQTCHMEFTAKDPEDLEGSDKKPGLRLKALRKICQTGAQAIIVSWDEADGILNHEKGAHPAKRTFNVVDTTFKTEYFGNGTENDGIELQKAPTLYIVAGNKGPDDKALSSRFDVIKFPMPKPQALQDYADKLIQESDVYPHIKHFSELNAEITQAVEGCKTFRDVETIVPVVVSEMLQKTTSYINYKPHRD